MSMGGRGGGWREAAGWRRGDIIAAARAWREDLPIGMLITAWPSGVAWHGEGGNQRRRRRRGGKEGAENAPEDLHCLGLFLVPRQRKTDRLTLSQIDGFSCHLYCSKV